MNDAIRTQISAFVDGELPDNEAQMLLRRMSHDRHLRQQAAEYLSMGRAMRGERSVPGIEALRDRVAAAIGDRSLEEDIAVGESISPKYLRPVAGVAIAATVALAAILGLQQIVGVNGSSDFATDGDADAVTTYTVPDQPDERLREYLQRHNASSSYFGADSINARLVTLQFREGVLIEVEDAETTLEMKDKDLPESGAQ